MIWLGLALMIFGIGFPFLWWFWLMPSPHDAAGDVLWAAFTQAFVVPGCLAAFAAGAVLATVSIFRR